MAPPINISGATMPVMVAIINKILSKSSNKKFKFLKVISKEQNKLSNIAEIMGAIAEIPVIINNIFNSPFSFRAIVVSIAPKTRNIRPKIATTGKRFLLNSVGGVRK